MKINITVSDELVLNALISGIEGGIRYWAGQCTSESGKVNVANLGRVERFYTAPFSGGHIVINETQEIEPKNNQTFKLTLERLQKGLVIMAEKHPFHFARILRDNSDRITGDVLVQLSCFEDIKYV